MKPIYLIILLVFCFPFQLVSQFEINTADELKDYIGGEWQLRTITSGWTGEIVFPQESHDYRLSFTPIDNIDSTVMCTCVENDTVVSQSIVTISFDENHDWRLGNLIFPSILPHDIYYINREVVSIDSFLIRDFFIDGQSFLFSKEIVSGISELPTKSSDLKVFPNPTNEYVQIGGIEVSSIMQIEIYSDNGQLQEKLIDIKTSKVQLPDFTSLFIMKFLMNDGSQIIKKISKVSNN